MTDDLVGMPEEGGQAPAADQGNAADGAAQNGTLNTASGQRLGGITGKGFMPGQSGNPNGRPKGLARLIRSRTGDGERLVELMLRVAFGGTFRLSTLTPTGVVDVLRRPSVRDRMDSVAWLADRGWGKVKDVLKLEGEEGLRRPATIVFLGAERRDPLADAAPPAPRRMLPPPPAPTIAEVEFELDGIDLPPKETP